MSTRIASLLMLMGSAAGISQLPPQLVIAQPPRAIQPPRSLDPAAEDPQRRETLKLIFDCEQALAEGRDLAAAELFDSAWSLAVQREDPLLTLSSDATDQLKPGEHRVQAGARVRLERIYAGAANEFRQRYAEFVSVPAEKAEQDALIGSRTQELERFTIRYQFTERAQMALQRLIHLRVSRGEFLQAALQYGRLLRLQKDEQIESRTRLAFLWWKAQLPEEAVDYLRDVVRDASQRDIELAGAEYTLPAADASAEQLLNWLRANASSNIKGDVGELVSTDEWLQPRGNYRRTTLQQPLPALLKPEFSRSTYESVLHSGISDLITPLKAVFLDRSKAEIGLRGAAMSAAQPLAVGDTVVYRTPIAIMAFSTESGELLWETSNADIQLRRAQAMHRPDGGDYPPEYVLRQLSDEFYHHLTRTHGSGQLTSDGRFVYVVEDSSAEAMRNLDRSGPATGPPFNFLRAYDLASGSLLGQAGGETGLGGRVNPMAGMFFLGAPLVMGERIYVMAENDQGIFLIELRARPMFGRTRLAEVDLSPVRSQLLTIPRAALRSHPARKFAGIIPSYSRGLLVCGTCDERVVAVSAEDHSVRWIYRYASNVVVPEGARDFTFNSVPSGELSRRLDLENRWLDALPKISGGRVFLTPRDSDQLICLELKTGRELWSRARGTLREIIVVDDERVILAGAGSVEALNAASGKQLWLTDLNTFVSGRCTASRNLVHVPTIENAVVTLGQLDGRRLVSQKTGDHVPGNLLSTEGKLISQNIGEIAVMRTPVDAADSGLARANRAFFEGQPQVAEAALREAVDDEMLGEEERFTARRQLIVLLLEKLKSDFTANAELVPVLHELFAGASATNQQIADFLYGAIGLTPTQLKELPELWRKLDTLKPLRDELIRLETAGTLSNSDASATQLAEVVLGYLRSAENGSLRISGQPSLTQSANVQAAGEIRDALALRSDETRNEILAALSQKLQSLLKDDQQQMSSEFVTALLLADFDNVTRTALFDGEPSIDDRLSPLDRDRLLLAMKADDSASDTSAANTLQLVKHWQELGRQDLIAKVAERSERFADGERKTSDGIDLTIGDRLAISPITLPEPSNREDALPKPWQGEPKVTPSAAHSAEGTFPQRIRAKSPQWNIPLLGAPGAFAGWSFTQQTGSPLIIAHDQYGRRRWTFNHGVIRVSGRRLSSIYAVAWGNVLALKLDRDVRVLNTLQLTDSGTPQELWRIRVPTARRNIPMWQRVHQYDVQPSGHTPVGPPSAIGIPILSDRAVTMFDLVNGRPLWRVSGLRDDTTITCDGQDLCLITPSVGEIQVRRAADGQLVDNHSIPAWWIDATENTPASIRDFELESDEEQRWRISVFRNECLVFKRTTKGAALESHSLASNNTRWSIPLPVESVVSNIVDGHVAVLSDTSRLQIIDLVDGNLRTALDVSAAKDSRYLYLRPSRENWIVLTDILNLDEESYPVTDSKPINGFAWAINRQTSKLEWEQSVDSEVVRMITTMGGLPPIPHVVPLLMLLKRYEGPKAESRLRGRFLYRARFIDTATGRVLYEDDDLGINLSYHGVELNPAENTIEFSFNKRNVLFEYGSED